MTNLIFTVEINLKIIIDVYLYKLNVYNIYLPHCQYELFLLFLFIFKLFIFNVIKVDI